MTDVPVLPWLYCPRLTGFLTWDAETGGYALDADSLPHEEFLLALSRVGLAGDSGSNELVLSDGDPVFVVGVLAYRESPGNEDVPAPPAAVRFVSGSSGVTGATRAGTSGPFYPFKNQRDGQPVYEPTTPALPHGPEGPRIV